MPYVLTMTMQLKNDAKAADVDMKGNILALKEIKHMGGGQTTKKNNR